MNLGSRTKGPEDVLPYDFDLDRWLEEGDRVDLATASITAGTAAVDSVLSSERSVRVWVSGGVSGETNVVTLKVTTLNQLTKEFCLHLRISRC